MALVPVTRKAGPHTVTTGITLASVRQAPGCSPPTTTGGQIMTIHRPPRRAALLGGIALVTGALFADPAGATGHSTGDLTEGAVFAMSNARTGNVVVAYHRNPDGSIDEVGRYDTGGTGSGSFEDSANGLVLATAAGEIGPNNLVEPATDQRQLLVATNAGSNSVSVFHVRPEGLHLVEVQDSNGEKPVSVTVNDGLVYVLNSGETNDSLFDADGNVIANCTTGERPSVTGFHLEGDGALTPIPGSTRRLGNQTSGCAQVSFTPTGEALVVTERLAQPRRLQQQRSPVERLDDEGVITTFMVDRNGRLGRQRIFDATGQGPFGFTFTRDGDLLTTEQFDGPDGPGLGAAASYQVQARGTLLRSSPSIRNGGTDTCWIVVTDDQRLAFTTSFFGDGRISSYEVDGTGLLRLIDPVATASDSSDDGVNTGASDLALSRDSAYLYQLNSLDGTVTAFSNNGDGSLTLIDKEMPFPQPAFGPGMGEGAPLGLTAS